MHDLTAAEFYEMMGQRRGHQRLSERIRWWIYNWLLDW